MDSVVWLFNIPDEITSTGVCTFWRLWPCRIFSWRREQRLGGTPSGRSRRTTSASATSGTTGAAAIFTQGDGINQSKVNEQIFLKKDARPAGWGPPDGWDPPVRAPGRSALWKRKDWKRWNVGKDVTVRFEKKRFSQKKIHTEKINLKRFQTEK